MKHVLRLAASVSFAFLLGSISVSAQNAGTGMAGTQGLSNAPVLLPAQNVNAGCPVRLRAQHGADGTMRKVDKSRPDGIAQKLHLTLTSNDSRQITEAGLRVRGDSGRGKLSQTKLSRFDAAPSNMDYTRNVTVKLRQSTENEAAGDVWVPGMSAVLEVELNFVKFADGGMQSFGASQGCRFTPDHLMLIAKDSY